jgi:thioredoxin 1
MANAPPSTLDEPIHVDSTDQFDELTGRDGVVLVDFYADWCGPCRTLEPTMETIAAETEATVLKVDIDAHGKLATTFGVQGVPNLVFFCDGEPRKRVVGVQSPAALAAVVDSLAE